MTAFRGSPCQWRPQRLSFSIRRCPVISSVSSHVPSNDPIPGMDADNRKRKGKSKILILPQARPRHSAAVEPQTPCSAGSQNSVVPAGTVRAPSPIFPTINRGAIVCRPRGSRIQIGSGWWSVAGYEEDRGRLLALKGTDVNSPGRRRPQPWGVECRDESPPCQGATHSCVACVTPARRGMRRGVASPRAACRESWMLTVRRAAPCVLNAPLQGFHSMAIR
jgi:hypothetical protein